MQLWFLLEWLRNALDGRSSQRADACVTTHLRVLCLSVRDSLYRHSKVSVPNVVLIFRQKKNSNSNASLSLAVRAC